MRAYNITERTGDRDGPAHYTIKDYAFCIPSNPMSDRGQMVLITFL